MEYRHKIKESHNQVGPLIPAGLLAIDLAIVYNFLSSGNLDLLRIVSLAALTCALPLLACDILLRKAVSTIGYNRDSTSDHMWILDEIFGFIASYLGIFLTFWHMSWPIAVLFFIASIPAAIIYGQHDKTLRKLEDTKDLYIPSSLSNHQNHRTRIQGSKDNLKVRNHKNK